MYRPGGTSHCPAWVADPPLLSKWGDPIIRGVFRLRWAGAASAPPQQQRLWHHGALHLWTGQRCTSCLWQSLSLLPLYHHHLWVPPQFPNPTPAYWPTPTPRQPGIPWGGWKHLWPSLPNAGAATPLYPWLVLSSSGLDQSDRRRRGRGCLQHF